MDSPLAIAYTALYAEHATDPEFRESMENVRIIVDKDMRKALMKHKDFRVIITSSGMAEGGPILAYLSQWVENERVEFSFPGYMAENTIGWKLAVRRLKLIHLPEEERDERKLNSGSEGELQQQAMSGVVVEAKINHYTHFSGHADEKDLFQWYRSLSKAPGMKLSIVHGVREGSSQSFLNTMKRKKMDVTNVRIPRLYEEVIVF
jgi:predicted metal-dependent RNase